jgi:tetratricopeptide (TPR) repeat protein
MQTEAKLVGRNDACPCGSGKKYKRCCALAEPRVAKLTPVQSRESSAAELLGLFQARRFPEVEKRAQELIARKHDSGLVWKLLGAALYLQKKDALPALERAAALLPDDAEAHTNLGNVRRANGHLEAAVQSHRRAVALQSDYAEAHNNLGSALKDLGRSEEAIVSYRRALALKPDFALAHANLAVVLMALSRLDEARSSLRRAIVMKPDFAEAHAHLGEVLARQGEPAEALKSFERAVELSPGLGAVHARLGVLRRESGDLERAAMSLRHALECNPQDAEAHNDLGIVQRELGLMQESAASFRRALVFKPDHPEVLNHLGNAQFDLGRPEEAAESYLKAVALRPDYAKALSNLGSAYRELGRLDEAEAAFLRALEYAPDLAEARTNLGTVQRLQGRPADAEASGRAALASSKDAPTTLAFLADLHADRGQFADALRLYQRIIELDPESPRAWAGIAGLRKMTLEDHDWINRAQRIVTRRLRPRDEIQLRYAIGKYFDDTKEFDRAFENYRRANELTEACRPAHDRRHLEQSFAAVRELYDERWLERMRGVGLRDATPVFVIGTPRSGTSLSEQILASHPAVFGAGELSYWKTTATGLSMALMQGDEGGALQAAGKDYLAKLKELAPEATRVVDKMPANFLYVGMIHAALPEARFIHMRRNPVDSCLSIYFQNFHLIHSYANDLGDLAHFYREYLQTMDHWRRLLPEGTLIEVDYEALVSDQEQWSRRMVEHIGLPWDPRCLQFQKTERTVTTFSKWQVRQQIHQGSVARWRRYEKHLGPLLELAPTVL